MQTPRSWGAVRVRPVGQQPLLASNETERRAQLGAHNSPPHGRRPCHSADTARMPAGSVRALVVHSMEGFFPKTPYEHCFYAMGYEVVIVGKHGSDITSL